MAIRVILESSSQGNGPKYFYDQLEITGSGYAWWQEGSGTVNHGAVSQLIREYPEEFANLLKDFIEAKLPVFEDDMTRVTVVEDVPTTRYTSIP